MVHFVNEGPYYDDYAEQKHYLQILAKPGFPEQAREFTQAQTTLYDHIGRIGSRLMAPGDIVEGMSVVIDDKGEVTVADGKVFLDGLVMSFEAQKITIPTTGKVTLGVEPYYSIITATDDTSLLDVAQNATNYGNEGADRVQYTVRLTINDPSSAPIYTFENGKLIVQPESNDLTGINNILARRTYDESGNYKVYGLEVSARNTSLYPTQDKDYVDLSAGKAYVRGYEVTKSTASIVGLRQSTDTTSTSNELKRYVQGIKQYSFNNSSIKSIKKVTMDINRVVDATRSSSTPVDVLVGLDKSISAILKVSQNDTVYTYGVDYEISSSRTGINWAPTPPSGGSPSSGKSPETGTTYTVDMVVLENLESNMYSIVTTNSGEVLQFADNAPVPYYKENTQFIGTFTIEYEFYYTRKDLLTLDRDGNVIVIEGMPNTPDKVQPPINQNDNLLDLAVVTLSKSGVVSVYNIADTRTTMADLVRMAERLNNMEMNLAITNLDREAEAGEDATKLSGIYTEGFLNIQKADVYHPEFKAAIDLDNQEVTTQAQSTIFDLNINDTSSDVQYVGRIISAPFENKILIDQQLASERMLVNPYAQFNAMGFVELTPAVDTWIDEEMVTENKTVIQQAILRRWWNHRNASWADSERDKWNHAGFAKGGQGISSNNATGVTQSVTSQVIDSLITYMREREVTVSASNFTKNSDNIEGYFDSVRLNLTPTGNTQAGTKAGTVRSDANGKFTCSFTVPKNIKCGTVRVDFKNDQNEGSSAYTASGTKRTTINTVLTTITNVSMVDPLAQSFQFSEDRILTQVGLYMATKDNAHPLVVEVRNTVNGYPGTTCYDRILVPPEKIKTSEKGTVETVVEFNQPVYCEAGTMYCVTLLSDSNEYQTFTATLGEKDIITGKTISSQPLSGTLFSSSNAQTWTAHQTKDLKFRLYEAVYNPAGGVIVFDDVKADQISRILLATDYVDKKNAGINWEYSVDNGANWDNLENYSDKDMKNIGITVVKLRATVKVNSNTSPLMAKDNISLVTFLNDQSFAYVGRNVQLDAPYKQVVIQIDANTAKQEGIEQRVFFSADGSGTDWIELTNPTQRPVNAEFDRYTYTYNVPAEKTYTNYRHKVEMTTKNPLIRPRAGRLISIMRK